jgi:hypothetical protein
MAFGELSSGSIISRISKIGRLFTRHRGRRRQEFPTTVKVAKVLTTPRHRLQDMYDAAETLLTFTTDEQVGIATSAQPGACASTSGMWYISDGGAGVTSDWIDLGVQPHGRGTMKRSVDGRVGIFVGVDAAGHDVLCHEPQRFHIECMRFDSDR